MTTEQILTLLATMAGLVATILGGVWFIVAKAMGIGAFSRRVDEIDHRTASASCEARTKEISAAKGEIRDIQNKCGVLISKVETHDKAIEEAKKEQKETRADVIDTRATVRSHEREMEEIRKNIWIQSENISKITAALSLKEWGPVFSAKHSPRRLTDFGNRILEEVGGMEFLREHKDIFFRQIDGRNPKTAFDVERAANTACLMTTAEDIFNGMKNFVYNAPAYPLTDAQGRLRDYELTLDDVCYVLSIPLRDMYLQEHPEIMEQ